MADGTRSRLAWVKVARVGDIPSGSIKTFVVGGKRIAISLLDGEYFAIDDVCSHADCFLGSDGFMDGNAVICGCHGSRFDVKTGKVLTLPATVDIATYPVKAEGEDLLVAI